MEHLYHYTTAAGLYGILNQKDSKSDTIQLRLSNIVQMNDETEYQNGVRLFEEFLNGADVQNVPNLEVMKQSFSEMHENGLHGVPDAKDYIYTMSFSEVPDDLGQWRGYTMPGNGYCIAFNKAKIIEYLGVYRRKCCLAKCLYAIDEKSKWFDWAVKNFNVLVPTASFYGYLDDKLSLPTKVKIFLSTMKDGCFANEHEWRLICPTVDISDVTCHEYNGTIKSYFYMDFPVDVIEWISVGPDVKVENRKQALRIFLKKMHLDEKIPIRESGIPFRYSI